MLDSDLNNVLSESEFVTGVQQNQEMMKLLQCDWENKLKKNIERTISQPFESE